MPSNLRLPLAAACGSIVVTATALFAQGTSNGASPVTATQPAPGVAQQVAPSPEAGRTGGARRAIMAACQSDIQTMCADVARGGGQKLQCLKQNEAKLGADCRAAIANVTASAAAADPKRAFRAQIRQACATDIATVCGGVEKGQGGVGRCLSDNRSKLSPTCASAIAERRAQVQQVRQAVRQACAADAQSLCGDRTAGKPMMCLREKQAQASPGCQQALAQLPARRRHGASFEQQTAPTNPASPNMAPAPARPGKISDDALLDDELEEAALVIPGR